MIQESKVKQHYIAKILETKSNQISTFEIDAHDLEYALYQAIYWARQAGIKGRLRVIKCKLQKRME